MASGNTSGIRKTSRQKKPSLKALESLYLAKLKDSGLVKSFSSDEEHQYFTDSEEHSNVDIEKPQLIHETEIVHGEEIFGFQKVKQRDSLALKVAEVSQKTPHDVRRNTKSRIVRILNEDSESEYHASSDEETSSDSEEELLSQTSSANERKSKSKQFANMNLQTPRAKGKGKYTIKTDEYFENCMSNKIRTSNNTLDKLKTPRLPQYQLQQLIKNMRLSEEHEKVMENLSKVNETYFRKWWFLLNENFNVLLYGLGSKRSVIEQFRSEYLKDVPVIVVNGFFPTVSIKNILDGIIVDLFELDENPTNNNEACDLIIQEFKNMPENHLYLIIHNIEGSMICNSKTQSILARLASVKNIHLLASIDHINAPLIWDQRKLSRFKFIWFDVTTFLPYLEETAFESSMMVQQTGSLVLSALKNVFLSLTTNSKSIYTIIVNHQLDNSKTELYEGISFKELYRACRESFIVSSDVTLRAQLTEFIDHKMVKMLRSLDGTEHLTVPLPDTVLQKFLDEVS